VVGLLGRMISSSQGLYLNTGQHKHRKTRTHIKHPCPRRDSNPHSRLRAIEDSLCLRKLGYRDRQYHCVSVRLLCGRIDTCFDPAGSSSGNHYMNMSLVIGLFTNMDPDRRFKKFRSVCVIILTVKFKL
jgi:hypothetical protein